MKPLGRKAYGSIPHLPGSRLGVGDHHIEIGQANIATIKTRDKHDLVIVQEKLDGSNVAVAKINGCIVALTRSGYTAESSKHTQHKYFKYWVEENENKFFYLLREGERVCGEWLAMAHGTKYNLKHEPFVAFDLIIGETRALYAELKTRCDMFGIVTPRVLNSGGSYPIQKAVEDIKTSGHGAIDEVEGFVYRVERLGSVDFLCKYVHHHKQDGKYFQEQNNGVVYWNCEISRWFLRYKQELGL